MGNKKMRSLLIFIAASLFSIAAINTFKWVVASNHLDLPIFVWYIYLGMVLTPPLWAGIKFMDEWKKE